MKIEKIPIDKIKPTKYNPRKDLKPGDVEYEFLKRSINEFSLVEPLVWNERSGNLIGGHQRLKILIARGDKEAEVSVVNLDENKEKALNLALNKIQGSWDKDKLKDLFETVALPDIQLTGFSLSEVSGLINIPETEFKIEDFVFDDVNEPCWFVIRADILEYIHIKSELDKLKADGLHIEDSQCGEYDGNG